MKKFGTPIGAGPAVASEKVGFVGAGAPVEVVSVGALTLTFVLIVTIVSRRPCSLDLKSRSSTS